MLTHLAFRRARKKCAHSHCLQLLSSLVLSSCESPTSTVPRHVLEHMKSREYISHEISENHTAGDEQVGDGLREPKSGDCGGGVVNK